MPQTVPCGGDDGACGGGGGGCADVPQAPSIGGGGGGAEAAVDDEEGMSDIGLVIVTKSNPITNSGRSFSYACQAKVSQMSPNATFDEGGQPWATVENVICATD